MVLRTWQGPQKLFRAFFIFFNFFFFDFFLIFSIFFARTVYITIQCDRVYIKDLARAPEIVPMIFNFFKFFRFFLIFSIFLPGLYI